MKLSAPLIQSQGLGLAIAGKVILDRVDIAIQSQEIVTVIGPNGAGKTSLLQVLLGLQSPTKGKIIRRPGLTVGYLPQRFTVDPSLPLAVDRLLTLTRSATAKEIDRVLEEVKAKHLRKAQVSTLSGGELQRVLLARALIGQPQLLILDEPTQGVDMTGEAEFYRLIADIRRVRGCAVLLVSHDIHLVMAATDRVICLNRHICCHGLPDAVGRDPEFLRLFGSRAAEAFALYVHHHDHDHDLTGDVKPMDAAHIHGPECHG